MLNNNSLIQSIPVKWLDWILELLMKGVPPEDIISRCCLKGVDQSVAEQTVDQLLRDPLLQTCLRHLEIRAKSDSLMQMLAKLKANREVTGNIFCTSNLSRTDFFENFFYANRPAVLTGLQQHLQQKTSWDPRDLAKKFGSSQVSVSVGRRFLSTPPYAIACNRQRMSLSEAVRKIMTDNGSNLLYITADDRFFGNVGLEELYRAALFECPILNQSLATTDSVRLWMGPENTHTPLHHDRVNLLFVQVFGRKRIYLCAPEETRRLGNDYGCWSSLSFKNDNVPPDIPRFLVDLHAGDSLFLPAGWWHEVISLDTSITITYDNFNLSDGEAYSWEGVYWIRNCPDV